MTGGGSGGHITPILAVAHELKLLSADTEIVYIGQRGDALSDIPAADPNIDSSYAVSAGKFRRYADEGWIQLLNLRMQVLNIRDGFRVLGGIWQSYWLLRRLRPDIVFTRGGFVSVPVALGACLNHIPYITHDSDSTPSLANRMIARWAAKHAVALPVDLYPYPAAKTVMVGVPVSSQYQRIDAKLRTQYREALGLEYDQIVFLTGGGNGARVLNQAMAANARYLLGEFPGLAIVHVAGRSLEAETNAAYDALKLGTARNRVKVYGFVSNMYRYSGAADVVITRAGATILAELAMQGLACVIVPAQQLGWDVQNAAALAERGAVVRLTEDQADQPERLGRAIGELLHDDTRRSQLRQNLATFARPHAAADLAVLLFDIIGGKTDVAAKK